MKSSVLPVHHERISRLAYIPAIVSLLPIIGIPFGISAMLWGISDRKIGGRKIIEMAGIGFVISLLFVLVTFHYYNQILSSPSWVAVRTNYSQEGLAFIVRFLEFYKSGHGQYPSSLESLREEGDVYPTQRVLADPFTYNGFAYTGMQGEHSFYYSVSDDGQSYDLFSIGPDKIAFTQDDIYPVLQDWYKPIIGLRFRNTLSP